MRGKTMIRSLRQRHRRTVFVLSVVIPAVFTLGIATRREIPSLPSNSSDRSRISQYEEVWKRDNLWAKTQIETCLMKGPSQFAVTLQPRNPITEPDILIYWVPEEVAIDDAPPESAFLIGSFDPSVATPLALPKQAAGKSGRLLMYSLANQEIVAFSNVFSAS